MKTKSIFNSNEYELMAGPLLTYKHYILVDNERNIIDGWSSGFYPNRNEENTICINENGTYQFRLFPYGEENPVLYTMDYIPLYCWDGEKVVYRTEEEIEDDRANIPDPLPSLQEQMRADIDFLAALQGVTL